MSRNSRFRGTMTPKKRLVDKKRRSCFVWLACVRLDLRTMKRFFERFKARKKQHVHVFCTQMVFRASARGLRTNG
jgi:hypothetical protein